MPYNIISIFLAAFLTTSAHAQSIIDEARIGVVAQSCCGYSPDNEQGVGINLEALFKSPDFLSVIGAPRPLVGGTVALDGDATSKVYAGLEWRYDWSNYFVSGSLGAAVHNGDTDDFNAAREGRTVLLGCRVLFNLGADIGYKITDRISASIHWSHISSASICAPNNGLDQLGARVGVRF